MKSIGIDVNLAPVVDLNINPENPDIGKVERSYSAQPADVLRNVRILNSVAKKHGIGLCLKHYPGLGGATVNSHYELTDISDSVNDEQLHLFETLAREINGNSILLSHGMVRQWDAQFPASISPTIVGKLRHQSEDCLLLSDDMQMQGLQKRMSTADACKQALLSGIDMICLGNNLLDQSDQMLGIADSLANQLSENPTLHRNCASAIARVQARKKLF